MTPYEYVFTNSEVKQMVEREKLSRRQRDRRRHKEEILAAALKLFAERGFHDVSMQEIAAQAEFATGTLYNFFTSKEALFEELTERCAEMIIGDLEGVLDGPGNEAELLRAFFRRQPELLGKHADFIKVYVSEVGTRGTQCGKNRTAEKVRAALDARIERLLEAGIRKGLFRPVDPAITTMAINSILETLAFEIAGQADHTQLTNAFAQVEQLFVDGLLLPEGQGHD